MGFSESEFYRLLPSAIGDFRLERSAEVSRITHPERDNELVITATQLPDRQIAMMRIPRMSVAFEFRGFSQIERDQFMAYFDSRFQRGGG